MPHTETLHLLGPLALSLQKSATEEEKEALLKAYPPVAEALQAKSLSDLLNKAKTPLERVGLLGLVATQQHTVVCASAGEAPFVEKEEIFLAFLGELEAFYASLGGIVGYQQRVIELLAQQPSSEGLSAGTFKRPHGFDLAQRGVEWKEALKEGITSLHQLAEVYPVGGLGSRLHLQNAWGEPLPAALLPFLGRSLLEGLIRDVEAKEFLYARLLGEQVTIPIGLMTSLENQNALHIQKLCEECDWFGRSKESFFLFTQLSVPVVTSEGQWAVKAPFELHLQPGGHGALWKAAEESGFFAWLLAHHKTQILIRQINNPLAATGGALLPFVGRGLLKQKTFGFASCERLPGAAEGMLIEIEKGGRCFLSNIEYTDLQRHQIPDTPTENGYSPYPANTNILYVDLPRLLPYLERNPLPALVLNMKEHFLTLTSSGTKEEKRGGRLESMMQNISDVLDARPGEELPTFLTYNKRRSTMSATKRGYEKGRPLLETPEGALYDLLYNHHELLQLCGASLPPYPSEEAFLSEGPPVFFLYHPALGPFYSLITQKIQRIDIEKGSELQLEIADLVLHDVKLAGSLVITAHQPLGHKENGRVRYSDKTGKCVLKNVTVRNRGIDREGESNYWKNDVVHHEMLQIILEGNSEFYAEGVTFNGGEVLRIPDGERWVASLGAQGEIVYKVEKPCEVWSYVEKEGEIILEQERTGRRSS